MTEALKTKALEMKDRVSYLRLDLDFLIAEMEKFAKEECGPYHAIHSKIQSMTAADRNLGNALINFNHLNLD